MPVARAVSPVLGVVLIVAIAVVLAATVAAGSLSVAGTLTEPAPASVQSTGEFRQDVSTACGNDAVVMIHEGGETIDPASIELLVEVPDGEHRERVVNLPVEGQTLSAENFEDDGSIVYDNCVRGAIAEGGEPWAAGGEIKIELNSGRTGAGIDPGDEIHVTVVHAPSGGVLAKERIVAS